MVNILLCGNYKVFDGALTELISITNRTKEDINCYIFTMDAHNLKPEYTCITDKQIDFLNSVVKEKNINNKVTKVDVTDIYNKEFANGKNEGAYCTPYTLLRLLADLVPDMPDKLLYLDNNHLSISSRSWTEILHSSISILSVLAYIVKKL